MASQTLYLALCLLAVGKLHLSDNEWKEKLGDARYAVMRKKGTERGFSGKYLNTTTDGTYFCVACETPLFDSKEKYDPGSGWPCFKQPISSKNIYYLEDQNPYVQRYEVLCRGCDSHLGHVFHDGPPPKELRYCINSIALILR